jgi:hypothetical protein
LRDDFYGGDTNSDSTATGPYVEAWGSIEFLGESLDPLCRMKNATIRYGGYYWSGRGAVYVNNASPTIMYCSFMQNRNGVYVTGASNPVINYCDIYQTTEGGVTNGDRTFNVDARYNWWGDNSGPTHASNPGGTGAIVTDSVRYFPFRTIGAQRPKMGDVSLNGNIQAYDGSLVLKFVADSLANPLNATQREVSDVSGESGITAYDASLVLQYVVGKITTFPAEHSLIEPAVLPKHAGRAPVALGSPRIIDETHVAVPLLFSGVGNAASTDLVLTFDGDLLTISDIKVSDAMGTMQVETASGIGYVRIAAARTSYDDIDGIGAEIVFERKPGNGTAPVLSFARVLINESDVTELATGGTLSGGTMPVDFALLQNYPNPFNPATTVSYQIPDGVSDVRIEIYDILGGLVNVLVDETKTGGTYAVRWDGTNRSGSPAASGMYYCRMTASGTRSFTDVKKMLLLK